MTQRPFRFGVQAMKGIGERSWTKTARWIEALGYSTLLLPDHFGDQLAPIPAMMAAADATTALRVGSFVFDNDYHYPVLLAKEGATLDVLSGGRFELGIGAGWDKPEYERAGIPFDPPGVRVGRMEEAVRIIKELWSDAPVTFEGKHYTVHDLDGYPKPLQRPHPPVMIAGGGKRLLSIAGREADIVGLNPRARPEGGLDRTSITAESTAEKLAWVREAAGERFGELELNLALTRFQITDDREAAEEIADELGFSPRDALESPHILIGTLEECVETLRARRERYGLSYFVVGARCAESFAPIVEQLAEE